MFLGILAPPPPACKCFFSPTCFDRNGNWTHWKRRENSLGCSLEFPACCQVCLCACPVLRPPWPACLPTPPLLSEDAWVCVWMCVWAWAGCLGKPRTQLREGMSNRPNIVCKCVCVWVGCVSLRKHLSCVTVSSAAFIWPLSHQVASWFASHAAPRFLQGLADVSSSSSFAAAHWAVEQLLLHTSSVSTILLLLLVIIIQASLLYKWKMSGLMHVGKLCSVWAYI